MFGRILILTFVALGADVLSIAAQQPISDYTHALSLASQGRDTLALEELKGILGKPLCFARAVDKFIFLSGRVDQLEEAHAFLESLPAGTCKQYGLARYFWKRRQGDQASQYAQDCVRDAPHFLAGYKQFVDIENWLRQEVQAEAFLGKMLQANPESAGPHYGLGHFYQVKRDWSKALLHLEKAVELSAGAWEPEEERYFVLYFTQQFDEALDVAGRMLDQSSSDPERQGIALGEIGIVYSDRGEYAKAIPALEHAAELVQQADNGNEEEIFRANLGSVYSYVAKYDDALAQLKRALELTRVLKLRQSEGRILALMADVDTQRANYAEAIQGYSKSLEIARRTGDDASEADQLASLSRLFATLGEYDKGFALVRQALTLSIEQKHILIEGTAHEIRGSLLADLGRYQEASQAYRMALTIARKSSDKRGEAVRLAYRSEMDAAQGKLLSARGGFEEALRGLQEIGEKVTEGRVWNDLALVDLRLGNLKSARNEYSKALEIGEHSDTPEVIWRAQSGLSKVAEASGLMSEALERNRLAIEAVERIRSRIGLPEEKATFLENKLDLYKRQVRLLLEHGGSRQSPATAFDYAERAHARSFLENIAESHLVLRDAAGLGSRQKEIEARLSQLYLQLRAATAPNSPSPKLAEKLSGQLTEATEEFHAIQREIRKQAPDYAAFRYPEPVVLEEAQKLIPERSLLLAYTISSKSSFLFAIGRDEYRVMRLPSQATIEREVKELREAIAKGPAMATLGNYIVRATALERALIEPARPLLAGKHELIIIPDGALHYLPFAALVILPNTSTPVPDASKLPFLIRRYSIRYAPSVSVLAALRDRQSPTGPAKALLAVGGALYSRLEPASQSKVNARGDAPITERPSLLEFKPLPQSLKEVESIARLYPASAVTLLTREAATVDAVTQKAQEHRILHFAVHSLIDPLNPEFSGLVFSPPVNRNGNTGILQVFRILNLQLHADLVVLSACDTGLGKRLEGEGIEGLTQAFLYAGSRAAVVSLWKVEDRATTQLMFAFHRELQHTDFAVPQALRLAQLELLKQGYAHPYFWAAFSVVGESR